jgi:hypothetical protein
MTLVVSADLSMINLAFFPSLGGGFVQDLARAIPNQLNNN